MAHIDDCVAFADRLHLNRLRPMDEGEIRCEECGLVRPDAGIVLNGKDYCVKCACSLALSRCAKCGEWNDENGCECANAHVHPVFRSVLAGMMRGAA